MPKYSLALAVCVSVVLLASSALADEPPPATATPISTAPAPAEPEPDLKRVGITLNPLGLAIGHYSIQGDILLAPHHAITINPFYAHVPVKIDGGSGGEIDAGSLNGFGGELGYRFYSSRRGPAGFFIGPSFLFASYSQSGGVPTTIGSASSSSSGDSSFTSVGGALDLGGQGMIGPGVLIGGGFGLQYTKPSKDFDTDKFNLASSLIAGGGFRPRFLFSIGFAF